MTDLERALRGWVTDWNGAPMARGEPPRDGIHCDVIYDAIEAIAAARREGAEEAMKQFHELEFVSLNELKEAERRGAEGMRERLIAALRNECERDQSFVDLAGPDDWERVMRAEELA